MANPADPGAAGAAAQQPGLLADLSASGTAQAASGTAAGAAAQARQGHPQTWQDRITAEHAQAQADQPHPAFHGRPVSWVAVSLIMAAFLVGGLALVFGPTWWLFWVAVGVVVVGGLLALSTNIFEDWY